MSYVAILVGSAFLLWQSSQSRADEFSLDESWVVTRERLRWPEYVSANTSASECYRLKLEPAEGGRGDTIRVLCCVEHVRGTGQLLVNPFAEKSFPRSVAVVVFDSNGRFVHSLPRDVNTDVDVDDGKLLLLGHHEMRGKLIEIGLRGQNDVDPGFSLSLHPGAYQIQLVASRRFFSGEWIAHGSKEGAAVLKSPAMEVEEMRSNVIRFTVEKGLGATPPRTDRPEQSISVQLTAGPLEGKKTSRTGTECILRVQNHSQTQSIGLIDPFSARPRQYVHPVRWILNVDGTRFDTDELSLQYPFRPRRSDFVILPPGGCAAGRVRQVPLDAKNYDLTVDIKNGIVMNESDIEVLRSGDPEIGWKAGGVDSKVFTPDSRFRIELRRE